MITNNNPIRVRIAPSPTGNCHVGTARTALYNYLYARQQGGQFILRVDDTDTKRNSIESEQGVFDGLKWIGLTWDEGPDIGGPTTPYRQSERLAVYAKYANELLNNDLAYECFCSPEELEAERHEQMARKEDPHYSGKCRMLSEEEKSQKRAQGLKPTIRLKARDGVVSFDDYLRGKVEVEASTIKDFVILKSNGLPVYNFATVIDEHEMAISHVIRGAEHLMNTFPQVLIYEALGWKLPVFVHLVLMLNPDKSKISKRKGAVYLGDFAELGYLPEALLNFVAFLGWNPGGEDNQEILSLEEMTELFSLERCTQSNAVFDQSKLDWMNGMWIRRLSAEELTPRVLPFMQKAGLLGEAHASDLALLTKLIELIHERLPRLDAAPESLAYFYKDWQQNEVEVSLFASNKITQDQVIQYLHVAKQIITDTDFETEALEQKFKAHAEVQTIKLGDLLTPLRIACTNRKVSPPLFATIVLIGREKVLLRIEHALTSLLNA